MQDWRQLLSSREFRALLGARRKLLLLDYDGTLAPFTVERHKAVPYPGVRQMLGKLARSPEWRVVIVSGRPAAEVAALLELEIGVEIFGCHGGERLRSEGGLERQELAPGVEKALTDARFWAEGQRLDESVEVKHGCLAIHVRGLTPPRATEVLAQAWHALRLIAQDSGAEVLRFDGGVELRCAAFNKGRVVQRLLDEEGAHYGPDLAAAYLGDDRTDEDAFRALDGAGLCVLVGRKRRASLAGFLLRPPEDLLEFLQSCLVAASAATTPEAASAPGEENEPARSF